jgi:nucleoid DNA-binding protein
MKQSELIMLISKDTGVSYDAVRKVLRKLTKYMCVALETKEPLRIGLGTFSLRERGPKPVQNFITGERYVAPPAHTLAYAPSAYVKATVKKLDFILQESIEDNGE